MTVRWKFRLTAAMLLATLVGIGCNPLTGAYFLLFGVEDRVPPKFQLAKGGSEVTVLVLTSMPHESKTELLGVERQLAAAMGRRLDEACKTNKEKVSVVPAQKVDEYKSTHPNWKSMTPADIGKRFGADYVLELEVTGMSLYETGSRQRLYRGRCGISMAVFDVSKPNDEAVFRQQYTTEYPKTRGPIPADDDTSLDKFRELFLARVATDLGWYLTAQLSSDRFTLD